MINNFITRTNAGLYCEAGDFYLDPKKAVQVAIVSHAHADHAVSTLGKIYCTEPTRAFMSYRQKAAADFQDVKFNIPFHLKEVRITFYPAGHILGSAQILMEYKNEKYLYTGDFKIQVDESCEPFEFVECDHLITETTFASPEYTHPDPIIEIKRLLENNVNVVIGAYALGKAQRITHLISKYFPNRTVYIHPQLESYHKLYAVHGYSPGEWKQYRRNEFLNDATAVYLVPPAYFKRFISGKNVFKVFATGWKKPNYRCDDVLQISDHADWNGVLEIIKSRRLKRFIPFMATANIYRNF